MRIADEGANEEWLAAALSAQTLAAGSAMDAMAEETPGRIAEVAKHVATNLLRWSGAREGTAASRASTRRRLVVTWECIARVNGFHTDSLSRRPWRMRGTPSPSICRGSGVRTPC